MNYHKEIVPIQELAAGDTLNLQVHTFEGSVPGPTVYLQGNLHGPEVFGAALLVRLVCELKKKELPGKIVIVPCANPIGVGTTAYNSIAGRWNPQNGTNWNRIFTAPATQTKPVSIESVLARVLASLSADANYVLDIHTTGSVNAEHLFTYPWMHGAFAALAVPIHLSLDPSDTLGAFDESHVLPFLATVPKERIANVATWEAHHHGTIDADVLKNRLAQVLSWLDFVTGDAHPLPWQPTIYAHSEHLHAPCAGYYSWTTSVGARVGAGETYAQVHRVDGTLIEVKAVRSFTLLGIYGAAATASGEQIAWIAY